MVGEIVRLVVGLTVGDTVGLMAGLTVGEIVGLTVGLMVGEIVGLMVGLMVGETVGLVELFFLCSLWDLLGVSSARCVTKHRTFFLFEKNCPALKVWPMPTNVTLCGGEADGVIDLGLILTGVHVSVTYFPTLIPMPPHTRRPALPLNGGCR